MEAQLVLTILEQDGIIGTIKGEHLQGLERLQSGGFQQVFVSEADYENAKKIVDQMQIDLKASSEETKKTKAKSNPFLLCVASFMAGAIVVALVYYTPIIQQKMDNNNDGKPDEKSLYLGNRLSKTELDRNFDGKVDLIYKYNREGFLESSKSDEDFDGTFETKAKYRYNNALWLKSDTNGDGFLDYHVEFKDGVLDTVTFVNSKTRNPIKVQYFKAHKLKSAKLDTNNDGIFDLLYEYDSIEEVISKKSIARQ